MGVGKLTPIFGVIMADKDNYEDLIKANGKYHAAIDKILAERTLDVAVRTEVGVVANRIFTDMKELNEYLAPYYQ
jgi:heme oxygenase